jgi:hypothetical protein
MSLDKIAIRLVDMSTFYYGNVIFRSAGGPFGGRFSRYRGASTRADVEPSMKSNSIA